MVARSRSTPWRGLELEALNDSFGQPAIGRQDTKIGVPQIGIVHRFKQDLVTFFEVSRFRRSAIVIVPIIQINQQAWFQLISVAAKLTDQGRFYRPLPC